MKRPPPRSTRTNTLLPDTTRFRSGDHSTGSASNRNRERTEARLELGLNKAPALFADRTDFIARGGRIDDRPVRTAFEHRLLKPRLALHGVRCREQKDRKSTRLNSSH